MAVSQKEVQSSVSEDVREYELMVILPPDLTETDLNTKVQDLREALSQHGGKVLNEEITPVRNLAYRIGKFDRGTYATFHFSFPINAVQELEKLIRIEMGVVRHMIVTCPKNYIFKGIMAYEEEADALRLKESEEKKAKDNEAMERRNSPRPVAPRPARAEKPTDVPASAANVAPKTEVKVEKEEAPAPAPKAAPKADLSKVDEQLKAILDNPDISL